MQDARIYRDLHAAARRLPIMSKTRVRSQSPKRRRRDAGCRTWLEWLLAWDKDAFRELAKWIKIRVAHHRMVRDKIPYPAVFKRAIAEKFGSFSENGLGRWNGWGSAQRAVAPRYVRYIAQRWAPDANNGITLSLEPERWLNLFWDRGLCARPSVLGTNLSRYTSSKDDLIAAGEKHGIVVRKSWPKDKLLRKLLDSAELPRPPRFTTWLVHRVHEGAVYVSSRNARSTWPYAWHESCSAFN